MTVFYLPLVCPSKSLSLSLLCGFLAFEVISLLSEGLQNCLKERSITTNCNRTALMLQVRCGNDILVLLHTLRSRHVELYTTVTMVHYYTSYVLGQSDMLGLEVLSVLSDQHRSAISRERGSHPRWRQQRQSCTLPARLLQQTSLTHMYLL